MGGPVRVLIVEGHGIVRAGVRLLLGEAADIVVAGEAADGAEALGALGRLAAGGGVDLVLSELALPDMAGPALARRLKADYPGIRVLFLSALQDDAHLAGLAAGDGDGYILKQAAAADLAPAIRAVMAGELYLSPPVARRVLHHGRQARARASDALSPREREVLGLLAEGMGSKAIALALGVRAKTVENHRAAILGKLGTANTAAAIGLAHREGLLGFRPSGAA